MKVDYESYKRFCEVAHDDFGNRLESNLNDKEIKQWEDAINKLAYEG